MEWKEEMELRFAEQRLALADLPSPSFSAFSPAMRGIYLDYILLASRRLESWPKFSYLSDYPY